MAGWKNDNFSLESLDKRVSASLQNLSVRLNGAQMDLQLADSAKLNELFILMAGSGPVGAASKDLDPGILAEVAQRAGMGKEEMVGEMQGLGLHLDQIEKGINKVFEKLEQVKTPDVVLSPDYLQIS
jgi:hypothetical protein